MKWCKLKLLTKNENFHSSIQKSSDMVLLYSQFYFKKKIKNMAFLFPLINL